MQRNVVERKRTNESNRYKAGGDLRPFMEAGSYLDAVMEAGGDGKPLWRPAAWSILRRLRIEIIPQGRTSKKPAVFGDSTHSEVELGKFRDGRTSKEQGARTGRFGQHSTVWRRERD